MEIFADTAGFIAYLDIRDAQHQLASRAWSGFQQDDTRLVTTNYVVVETTSLLGRRMGIETVRLFSERIVPLLQIYWVDLPLHDRAVAALLAANQRRLSLVDCVSFEVLRDLGIADVFTFDSDFQRQGFRTVP